MSGFSHVEMYFIHACFYYNLMIELLDHVFNYTTCMLTWLLLMLMILWCTFLWLNELVLFVGMVLLNMQKWKVHTLWNVPFSKHDFKVCLHSFISTCGVLTPFLPFLQHFRFRLLKCFFKVTWRRLGSVDHPTRVGPHILREMPLSSSWSCFEFKTSIFLFSI